MSELTIENVLRVHAPQAPQALRQRVLALEPVPRRRRWALAVVPAAVAAAVVAAVVHGVVGSSSPKQAGRAFDRALPAQGNGAVASAPERKALTPSVGAASRLQRTDASLQVRVSDVQKLTQTTAAATRIATSLGGYAQSVVYRAPAAGEGAAYIELRVPAQNVKTALTRLAALGTLVSQQLSVQDLQHDFEVETAQIAGLRRTVAALQTALRNSSLPEAQRVLLQIKLAESKRALFQRLHGRKGTLAAGTTARISLVLSTQKSVVPAVHHRGRLGRMLHSAVGFLGLEGTIALYALIVISPIALVAALGWWLRGARRRRLEALVM
ncbi:MAG TPA: DUF4349 domain-containing protein [Burkholderiales bacterium]